MSDNFRFPTDTCVLVCSGPSLNLVNPFELGLPVVAISTAIRKIPNPHYWILADYLNEMHGPEGNSAYQNENILKIVPKNKINPRHASMIRNYKDIHYSSTDKTIPNVMDHLFSGNLPLLKGPHKSVTFAIQWLHHVGVKNVIWVGNNLHAASAQEKYAYESTALDLKKSHNYTITLDQVHRSLKDWYPKAKSLGYTWYSWKSGDVFEKIVPAFDYDSYIFPENSAYYAESAHSIHPLQLPSNHSNSKSNPKSKKIDRKPVVLNKKSLDKQEKKITNLARIKKQAEDKAAEIEVRKNTSRIQNTPKSEVSVKKYPKYVKINNNNNKSIRDALR